MNEMRDLYPELDQGEIEARQTQYLEEQAMREEIEEERKAELARLRAVEAAAWDVRDELYAAFDSYGDSPEQMKAFKDEVTEIARRLSRSSMTRTAPTGGGEAGS